MPVNSNISLLNFFDEALQKVTSNRVMLGEHLNNLQHSFNDAGNSESNLTASLSQIEDIKMATAVMKTVKNKILLSSNESMLSVVRQNNENVNTVLNKWLS